MNRAGSWVRAGLLVVSCATSAPLFAADAAAGKAAYAVCAACHGEQGEGNIGMNAPKLAGQSAWYLRRQLDAYRSGMRGTAGGDPYGMQMRPMAMAVSDPTAIDNLIAYITSLPDAPTAPTVTGDVAAGKSAYGVCAACHGVAAEGNEQLGAPRLAGQSDWYLVRQINNFNRGLRGYDPKDTYGNQMKPMAATLTSEKAIDDVVAYIDTLD